ncbi:MAG: hypothetical protein MJY76_05885 [Bacteroidales bacterium]|nr:hypothetical protein [Bacteroidales bacterium]
MKNLNFLDMSKINGGSYFNACDVALGLAVGVWSTAIGAFTFGIGGALFGVAAGALTSRVCHIKTDK